MNKSCFCISWSFEFPEFLVPRPLGVIYTTHVCSNTRYYLIFVIRGVSFWPDRSVAWLLKALIIVACRLVMSLSTQEYHLICTLLNKYVIIIFTSNDTQSSACWCRPLLLMSVFTLLLSHFIRVYDLNKYSYTEVHCWPKGIIDAKRWLKQKFDRNAH